MYHGMKGPENNFQIYRAINDPCQATFVLRDFTMGNHPKMSLKYAIFKICPKLARKLYSCETSVFSNIIGDRWRQKVVSVFKFGRQKSNFFAPKITKIGCFLVPKMGLWMPKSENGHHQLSPKLVE